MKNREHDDSFDRLLRRGLVRDPDAQATSSCLDADTAAAWMDGALTRGEVARAEAHASACDRCQALLAAMARTAPAAPSRPWWRAQTLRWMAPIAAAATALVIWVAVDRDRATLRPTSVDTVTATPAPSSDQPVARPSEAKANEATASGGASSASQVAPSLPASPRMPAPAPSARDEAASRRRGVSAGVAPPPPAAPAPPPASKSAEAPLSRDAVASPGVSERVGIAEMRPLAKRETLPASAPDAVEIPSPEPAFRWRLAGSAAIERSTDGGTTWTRQSLTPPRPAAFAGRQSMPASIVLTAGSAPARDVCWIVGRAGAVFVSTNGATWERKPFPGPLNLTAIRATDARSSVVTTEDGRQFSTIDGGLTWSKIP